MIQYISCGFGLFNQQTSHLILSSVVVFLCRGVELLACNCTRTMIHYRSMTSILSFLFVLFHSLTLAISFGCWWCIDIGLDGGSKRQIEGLTTLCEILLWNLHPCPQWVPFLFTWTIQVRQMIRKSLSTFPLTIFSVLNQ